MGIAILWQVCQVILPGTINASFGPCDWTLSDLLACTTSEARTGLLGATATCVCSEKLKDLISDIRLITEVLHAWAVVTLTVGDEIIAVCIMAFVCCVCLRGTLGLTIRIDFYTPVASGRNLILSDSARA